MHHWSQPHESLVLLASVLGVSVIYQLQNNHWLRIARQKYVSKDRGELTLRSGHKANVNDPFSFAFLYLIQELISSTSRLKDLGENTKTAIQIIRTWQEPAEKGRTVVKYSVPLRMKAESEFGDNTKVPAAATYGPE